MSAEAERIAIGTLFNDNWGSTTPVSWPNRDFTPPASGEWVRFTSEDADSFRLEIGTRNNHTRTVGVVIVQVFTPADTGDGRALELGEQVASIFRDQAIDVIDPTDDVTVIGRVIFRSPVVRPIGVEYSRQDVKGVYYQLNVSVPYVRDSVY